MAVGDIKIGKKHTWNPLSIGFFDALLMGLIGAFVYPYLFVAPFILWGIVFAIRTYIAFFHEGLKLPD